MSMQSVKPYAISAHPYLFDAFFSALQWRGTGHVSVRNITGGVHQARCVIEADDEGCRALKAAGFVVEEFGQTVQ